MNGPADETPPVPPTAPADAAVQAPAAPPAGPAKAKAKAGKKPFSPSSKSPRRRSRELALQGLYEWLAGGADAGLIEAHMREQDDYGRCDQPHFEALLHGCIREAADLDAVLVRHIDRRTALLSPVEHGVLLIGVYELRHCIEIPYRVVINEGVELAKSYGGTDGHKYVNGVLDKAAGDLRAAEVAAGRR